MGTTYSGIKAAEEWAEEYSPFRTYTLPRYSQRSVSLATEAFSSTHPDDKENSCRLISMKQHRFSRSHSLDEGRGLSPWALQHLMMIDEAHRTKENIVPGTLPPYSEQTARKVITAYAPDEPDCCYNSSIKNLGSFSSDIPKRLSNGWADSKMSFASDNISETSPSKSSTLTKRRSSTVSCASSALTAEAIGDPNGNELAWVDDDKACSLTDRSYSTDYQHCFQNATRSSVDLSPTTPEIIVTDLEKINKNTQVYRGSKSMDNSIEYDEEESTDMFGVPPFKPIKSKRRMRDPERCRKSEPSLPSSFVAPPSPLLGLPGLEIRRHTLPSSSNAKNTQLDLPDMPIFNTSSWETLPPAEEMVVMEDKPIQIGESNTGSPSLDHKSQDLSLSINSSLSSLSQLSVAGDFSENETWTENSVSLERKSSILSENDLSPDVFLDPYNLFLQNTDRTQQLGPRDKNQILATPNGTVKYFQPLLSPDKEHKPVIIDCMLKKSFNKADQRRPIISSGENNKIHLFIEENPMLLESNAERFSNGNRENMNSENKHRSNTPSPEPITGVLHISPISSLKPGSEVIFSVTIPERTEKTNQTEPGLAKSKLCTHVLDRRKSIERTPVKHSKSSPTQDSTFNGSDSIFNQAQNSKTPEKLRSPHSKFNKSINSILSELETHGEVPIDTEEEGSSSFTRGAELPANGETAIKRFSQNHLVDKRKRSSKIRTSKASCGTFSDFKNFLKEVETRIPPNEAPTCTVTSAENIFPSKASISLNASGESVDLHNLPPNYSHPTTVIDACTQTSRSPTPACGSPTTSFSWVSDCGCDGYSLEPCASSGALSGTEDDFDEEDECGDEEDNEDGDDDWSEDGSLSSSPPITPISPPRDDSSLSLSESLDNLDQNVESGIGTVSTRPSISPPVHSGAFDFSGSNLSSEDTGLEASFERRVRRYLPNSRGGRSSDHSLHYRRRRQRIRHNEHWVRRENQTTQTEPQSFTGIYGDSPTPVLGREVRASSEEARNCWKIPEKEELKYVRHTHSEPRLSSTENTSLNLRVVSSEAALPPLPHSHSRSFVASSALPTLSEGKPSKENPAVRPSDLPLGGHFSTTSKAISAPLLESCTKITITRAATTPSEDSSGDTPIIPQRTQSVKEISEIEAIEACKWLRAAGFPQYAQMYEDYQFPLDLVSVERDHSFLDTDSLHALFRRLKILNRCARIRHDSSKKSNVEDSDEEDQQCALAQNWKFQRHSRRWSRIDPNQISLALKGDIKVSEMERVREVSECSDDTNIGNFKRSGSEKLKDGAKALLKRMESLKNKKKRRHRDGIVISSPKVLDEAHMEARMIQLGCVDITPEASPELGLRESSHAKDRKLSRETRHSTPGEDSSSLASDHSQNSTPLFRSRRRRKFWGRGGRSNGGEGRSAAYSDSECSPPAWRHFLADANSNVKSDSLRRDKLSPSPERQLERSSTVAPSGGGRVGRSRRRELRHTTSLTYGSESHQMRENFASSLRRRRNNNGSVTPEGGTAAKDTAPPTVTYRLRGRHEGGSLKCHENSLASPNDRLSVYDNVPNASLIICNKTYHDYNPEIPHGYEPDPPHGYHQDSSHNDLAMQEGSGSSECTMESRESPHPSTQDDEEVEERPSRRPTLDRWHSFNRKSHPYSIYRPIGSQIHCFSVGQLNLLRKRALLRLTALIERYCPANRTTWNWELPKFMRKIKSPDYKDRLVFGVPLQVINQRIGQPLPPGILQALNYLKSNCLDQVGIFRKPGVRSRIQRLRELHELEEMIDYATFGPCDIADMVKTYFRELPEVLLTNKFSEIIIMICQYLPETVRLEALQCIMLMMPDENREALFILLTFLSDVAANSRLNQMNASNLAVCMAPSLFHLNIGNSGSSPLRRRATGTPEQKDLNDNKAAHECLTLMIQKVGQLQCLPVQMLANCSFTYLDQSQPVSLEELGEGNWLSYMETCMNALLKETSHKAKGWITLPYPDSLVEVAYLKVRDGHPLRLWRVTTEVEAPPMELLSRILMERHLWDENLLKWKVITKLGKQAEVFQYMCNSTPPRPPVDYCVLRCWRTNLPRGMCIVVETSVEHGESTVLTGGVRGIVLASRYLIQPCGSGKSRITHLSRLDMRGRLPEWYNKIYPYITAGHIVKLRQTFHHYAVGPESKV